MAATNSARMEREVIVCRDHMEEECRVENE